MPSIPVLKFEGKKAKFEKLKQGDRFLLVEERMPMWKVGDRLASEVYTGKLVDITPDQEVEL